MPTLPVLLQYVLDLTEKVNRLENQIETLKKKAVTKKSVYEYLQTIKPAKHLQQWIAECTVDENDLQILFEKNMSECIQYILFRKMDRTPNEELPFRCFAQKPNSIYVYACEEDTHQNWTGSKWRTIEPHEFHKLIEVITQRIIRRYICWKTEHQDEIDASEKMRELQMNYMGKLRYSMEKRIIEVKKALIQKIQVSLKYIE
jgi:chaperonin cofactor prefoldin